MDIYALINFDHDIEKYVKMIQNWQIKFINAFVLFKKSTHNFEQNGMLKKISSFVVLRTYRRQGNFPLDYCCVSPEGAYHTWSAKQASFFMLHYSGHSDHHLRVFVINLKQGEKNVAGGGNITLELRMLLMRKVLKQKMPRETRCRV